MTLIELLDMTSGNSVTFSGISLNALRVFDAAARQRNMVRAAAELHMTQGAVSRQIKALERQLNVVLFQRGPRGLTLTESGDLLADHVRRGFGEMATGLHRLGQPRRQSTLTVAAPRSFALRVLSARLGSFVRRHPWIDLRLDTHRYYGDLEYSHSDLSIRAGKGDWGGYTVERLTDDILFPVCAPSIPLPRTTVERCSYLNSAVLLHYAERPYWEMWLREAGLSPDLAKAGPRFSESALALVAAEAGQGIAIGRTCLVADSLVSGKLVRPCTEFINDGVSYFLVVRESKRHNSTVQVFCDWLVSSIEDMSRPH